jgi:uridine phosphorylase
VTTDAFYAGQARRGFNGYEAPGIEDMLEQLRASNVKKIEMEASAVLTLANLYGLRGGAVCTVFADRTTGEFRTEGEARAAETASLAAAILESMDERVTESDADRWHPGLGPI